MALFYFNFMFEGKIKVDNVQNFGGYVAHFGVVEGNFSLNDIVVCMVNYERQSINIIMNFNMIIINMINN